MLSQSEHDQTLCPVHSSVQVNRPAHGHTGRNWRPEEHTELMPLPHHCSYFFPNEPTLTKREGWDFLYQNFFLGSKVFLGENNTVKSGSSLQDLTTCTFIILIIRNSLCKKLFLCGQHCEAVKLDQIKQTNLFANPQLRLDHFWAHFLICETYWLFKKVPYSKVV